ncbi:L-lysine exporter family protein LysE/ArgO [Microbacteriaceae bacterium MWH-Ta3]|nr:L-lysine exporter family protein LysE/ArgO [Microbacteriaceae bacterium MWH-Ta3]
MDIVVAGFLAGLALIVAIGAQNAYVLRQGLARNHVGLVVLVCAVADALLILAGVAGFGEVVRAVPVVLEIFRWVGVVYLLWFAAKSFVSATKTNVLLPSEEEPKSRGAVLATVLALTFLNPHVYLDTVLFLGSLGNQYGEGRWLFAAGAMTGSLVWFSTIGFGARAAAGLMSKPIFWRILDTIIGLVMVTIALMLVTTDLG